MDNNEQKHTANVKLADYHLPVSFESSRRVRRKQRSLKTRKKQDDMVTNAIKKMFGKYVEINNENCNLPETNTLFTADPWIIEDLQKLKTDLNEMKSKLNDYNLTEWRYHTKRRNYAGHIIWQVRTEINPELLTQAWCKFYENLSFFELIPVECSRMKQLKSIHLCEAPGAFITALNHWLKLNTPSINWNWTATTLNPNYEGNSLSFMLNDDRFISHTMNNWYFGADNTGDLMKLQNLDALIELETEDRDKILLITADGSIDCSKIPEEQEKIVSHLHYCETITALHLLGEGGNFLIKLFTIFEYQTVCLMYLLSCCFKKVFINKPATSKEGNSEVYIVCLDFKGSGYISPHMNKLREHYENFTDRAMFRKNDIPSNFIEQIVKSGELFKSYQCEVISRNIETFCSIAEESYMDIKKIRKGIADYFIESCKLRKLPSESMHIVGIDIIDHSFHYVLDDKCYYNSYNDRQLKDNMTPEERLSVLKDDLMSIDGVDRVTNFQFCKVQFFPHQQIRNCMDLVYTKVDDCASRILLIDDCNLTVSTILKFNDDNLEALEISTAIPYENIQNSKFCQPKILKIYSLAYELTKKLTKNWYYPDNEAVRRFVNTNVGHKFLCFRYTLEYDGFNVIEKIHEAMANLGSDQTLILIGYSLLTQFNVGILYILAHTFEHVEMQVIGELGCVITLRNYISKKRVIEHLNKIFDTSIVAKKNNKIILSVISVVRLYDCDFYPKILEINHSIIKHFVHQVMMLRNGSDRQ